jgi:uncharacterized protein YehS (DUF1456 family)
MNNNDILRRIRYSFDYNDAKMVSVFGHAERTVTKAQVKAWLLKDGEPGYTDLSNKELLSFLDGFIIEKRGRQEGVKVVKNMLINNNIIFRKLKIALNLREEAILDMFKSLNMRFSKHELSSFFRNPKQEQYRACQDQFLRNFLQGIQNEYRVSEHKKPLRDRLTKSEN